MNIYFDCEMTSLSVDGELMSIALVTDPVNGRPNRFYAEIPNCKKHSPMDKWVLNNVYSKLILKPELAGSVDSIKGAFESDFEALYIDKFTYLVKGSFEYVRDEIRFWLSKFIHNKIMFVTDCGNTVNGDWHHLLTLIGDWKTANENHYLSERGYCTNGQIGVPILHPNILPICDDIVYSIRDYFKMDLQGAWDASREELVSEYLGNIRSIYGTYVESGRDVEGAKHNSLWDAEVIRLIYLKINKDE